MTQPDWPALFDALADDYDQSGVSYFAPIAAGLVEALAPAAGERALDVGAGRGAATIPLAAAVGPSGHVTAIDASARMVDLLSARTAQLPQVEVAVGDAMDPPGSSYDVVCSSLVLFFVADPVAALARWRALLTPGGRVGIATFQPTRGPWREIEQVLASVTPPMPAGQSGSPTSGPFETDAGVERLFRDAGFESVRTTTVTHPADFGGAARWRAFANGTGMRAALQRIPAERQDELTSAVDAILARCGGVLPTDVRYTLAG